MTSFLKILTLLLASATALVSCSLRDDNRWHRDDALYTARGVEVYPESVVIDGKEYTAIGRGYITNLWLADDSVAGPGSVTLTTPSRMADALWLREMEQKPHNIATPLDIYLGLALIDPVEAMETLRDLAPEGTVSDPAFPVISTNMAWTAAAWEVYCATGSTSWLKEAYSIAKRSLAARLKVLSSSTPPLIYSAPSYLSPLTRGADYYPSWMGTVDLYQSLSLGTNVWLYATLRTLSLMASELSASDTEKYSHQAAALRESINDNFWVPQCSWYGSYLYGPMYPILFPSADNMANPLCVILGIATPEMGRRSVVARPSAPQGFPTICPLPAGADLKFSRSVQSLQVIAAARVSDGVQMLRALGPLWALSMKETSGSTDWIATVIRGLLGITVSPEAMTVNPMIPAHFKEGISLIGLPWRESTLDINLRGAGNKIISFKIDSIASQSPSIPSTLTGHHTVDITLSGNPPLTGATDQSLHADAGGHENSADLLTPEPPRTQWISSKIANILNFDPENTYNLYLNGVLTSAINQRSFTVADTTTTVSALTAISDMNESLATRPHVTASADAEISIPATAITPRRPPLHLIRDRATADRYIELAARHNTRLTFYVNSPRRADYFISIDYTNGTDNTGLRTVEVNGQHAGVLVCPSVTPNNWVKPHPSSVITVSLNEGVNKISLTYMSTTLLLHRINLLRK